MADADPQPPLPGCGPPRASGDKRVSQTGRRRVRLLCRKSHGCLPWRGGGFWKREPGLLLLADVAREAAAAEGLGGAPRSWASGDKKRDERDSKVSVTPRLVCFLKGR